MTNEKTEFDDEPVPSSPRSAGTLQERRTPLQWPENREFRILSIDGGGIRGIFPAAVLAEIEQRHLGGESIANYFDLIVGTSTGGVIALGLGAVLTAQDLRNLYRDRGCDIFPPVGKIARAAANAKRVIKYGYNSEALTRVLYEHIGELTLAHSRTRLCIPSTEGRHGDIYVFKTPHHSNYKYDANEQMVKVALATSAAPTYLRPLEHNGYAFVDGGLWSNNPVMIGLIEALSAFDVERDKIKILSIGCGNTPFKIKPFMVKFGGFIAWRKAILAAMHFQSVNALGQASLLIGNDRITRIDAPEANPSIDLDDWKRATTELLPAAHETVDRLGESVASAFLTSRAEPYQPIHESETSKVTPDNSDNTPQITPTKEANRYETQPVLR